METMSKEAVDQRHQNGFNAFMATESTKVLIFQIPEGESREGLMALLKGAYDAGHGTGMATVMIGLLDSVLNDRKKP